MTKKASNYYYLANYEQASLAEVNEKSAPYIIGALCFRGEHDKARRLFNKFKSSFGLKELVFSRFHLGISYTRTSEYKEAEKQFLENWRERHEISLTASERFLIYQGLSFYRFFFSRHNSSLSFAEKARSELLTHKSPPPLFVALVNDLVAHNYYQLGRPAKGEVFLKKAIATTKENDFSSLEEEFSASLVIYRSQFDLKADKNITALKRLLKKTSESNDYTSSELVLQISKLYLLKGQFKKASQFLVQHFNTIYKNDNKRKVAKLNTLLAQLLIPKQQYIESLSLLKIAKSNLNYDIDINLLVPILGLEVQILKRLGQDCSEEMNLLESITLKTDKGILGQIHERRENNNFKFNKEDSLGFLFDKSFQRDTASIEQIIENELFYLMTPFCEGLSSKKIIYLHPQNLGLFLFDEEEILFSSSRLSKNQIRLLSLLESGALSKEEIIKEIWGYSEYDPFRHDHLVYSLVKRLRSVLGSRGHWVMSTGEDRYELDPDVNIHFSVKNPEKNKEKKKTEAKVSVDFEEDLNFRQIQIIEGLFERPFSAGEAAEYFNINRMTSYRDLNDLVEKGHLIKRGKNKGTRYTVP